MQPWDAHEFPKNNLSTYFYHDCQSNCAASGSIDWFRNQICLTLFLFKVSPSKKRLFKPLLGLVWRGPSTVGSTKCLYAPVLLQNALRMQDTSYPENSCFKGGSRNHPLQNANHTSVLCGWKELWAGILWTWVEIDYETERAGTY